MSPLGMTFEADAPLASKVGSIGSEAQDEPLSTTACATTGKATCGGSAHAPARALPCRAVAPLPRASVARLSLNRRPRRGGGSGWSEMASKPRRLGGRRNHRPDEAGLDPHA